MASLKRLITLSQPPQQLSERAWHWLRITHKVTLVLLGLMSLFVMTVFAGLFLPRQVVETAAITELVLIMLASVLTTLLGVWSLHLRLREHFKVGNILIAGAILMGSGTAGILMLIGFIYLVTR